MFNLNYNLIRFLEIKEAKNIRIAIGRDFDDIG